jgi:hypothetical protein
MAGQKRLVLMVEGDGDELAVPVLIKRLLTDQNAWDCVALDPKPMRVGKVPDLLARNEEKWVKYLGAARKRANLGGVLLILDGDVRLPKNQDFCAVRVGQTFTRIARQQGAGSVFSVAVVFALQEFESWLIAGVEVLAGKPLSPKGRPGVKKETVAPEGDLEQHPRDAKGWLRRCMHSGYKPTVDQEPLTRLLVEQLDVVRNRGLRSFHRLENALQQLVNACRSGNHVATPEVALPEPETDKAS